MPNPQDDPLNTFLECYGKYLDAREANQPMKSWLLAIQCRLQLQKMGDPRKEAQICENIFEAFVGKEQAVQIFRDLCDNSRSHPKT